MLQSVCLLRHAFLQTLQYFSEPSTRSSNTDTGWKMWAYSWTPWPNQPPTNTRANNTNPHPGQASTNTRANNTNPRPGQAYSIDGSSSYIDCDDSLSCYTSMPMNIRADNTNPGPGQVYSVGGASSYTYSDDSLSSTGISAMSSLPCLSRPNPQPPGPLPVLMKRKEPRC